ncbi:MAG: ABC transporter ATP-binding protein [bacterium]|nr:ABC transporter ATP-binding protein [bacterium]
MQEKEAKKVAPPIVVLKHYWPYVAKHPVLLGWVIFAGIAMQVVSLLAPWFMRQFFNILALQQPDAVAVAALLSTLGIIASLWVADRAFRRVEDQANVYLQSRIMAELYENTFDYLLGHSYNFFASNFAGSLTHKVSRFTRAFETIADNILIQFFPTALFVLGSVGVLYFRNHWLGIALGVWCAAFIGFQIFIGRLRQPIRAARSDADTKVTGALADAISNQSTIALFSGSQFEGSRLKTVVADWRAKTLRNWLVDGWTWGAIGLFVVAIQVVLMWGAVILWQEGKLTLGDFVLIQSYLLTTFNLLMGIGFNLRRFYDAFADAGEMLTILQTPHEVKDRAGAVPLKISGAMIAFKQVNFGFHEKTAVLNNFTVDIQGSQKVALVGPSGAGKTTITKLLLRLFDVKGGSIEIDGQNIASVTQESLRNAIAFVPQEPILFHRTLVENIRYGRRDATDAEVIEAAKKAHCHEFISQLPLKYETFVGERGIKLSGGERQRVAIARAILKNAPMLVLDEATSSLDSESEALIQDALETLMQGKTVIVIAHRLSTIMKMDRIVVLEHGTIVADGTHSELLAQEGLYKKLWSIQAGGFLVDEKADIKKLSDDEEQSDDLIGKDETEEKPDLQTGNTLIK